MGVEGFDHFGAATVGSSAISGVALSRQEEEVKEWEGGNCLSSDMKGNVENKITEN